MGKKKLVKKVVVAANLTGLNEADKLQKETDMATDMQNNPTIVPTINPTAAIVLGQITTIKGLITQRENLKEQVKSLTEQIHTDDDALLNVFNSQWAAQVQTAIAGDVSKAKLLGYGVKGQDNGHSGLPTDRAVVSRPVISRVDLNVHLQHKIHIINSISGKHKLPADAKRIEIYMQIGGTAPTDYTTMGRSVGDAKRSVFVSNFVVANLNTIVYYVAVYISKTTGQIIAQSPVATATVN